jgi:hypothetical protein
MPNEKIIHKNYKGGYTIIETMIAVTLFMMVTTLGLGALLNAHALHNKTEDVRSIMDSMSFVMEDMSRNLRIGYNYHCLTAGQTSLPTPFVPKSCAVGYGIAFEMPDPDSGSEIWAYYVSGHKLYKTTDGTAAGSYQLTPDEVVIESITPIAVLGAEDPDAGNTQQPFVTIRLSGTITFKDDVITPFSLQTAVSQRAIDI